MDNSNSLASFLALIRRETTRTCARTGRPCLGASCAGCVAGVRRHHPSGDHAYRRFGDALERTTAHVLHASMLHLAS